MNSKRLSELIILIFTIIIGCLGNQRNLERQIVARDGHYEKYENGIVHDTLTELEWYAGPDKDTTWYQA